MSSVTAGSSSINEFFPLWGVILGKTTWKQTEDAGNKVKIYDNGPARNMDVHNVTFWDHKGSGKFTHIYWTKYDSEFPDFWKSKGFSWNNSYNAWLSTLTYTRKSCHFRSQKESDNEAQDKNRARV